MDNHYYIPCCKGAFCFPKRRDTGTLPKAQAVPTGPHSTLSPKTAPKPGRWPHLRVLCGCWITGAWLGGHGFGSFLNLGVRHCPPKPLNRAFKFFSKPLQYPAKTEIMATSLLLLWFNPSLQVSPTEPLAHPCYSRMGERELHW